MTPEEQTLLKEIAELSRENNKLLKKIRQRAILGTIIKVAYWLILAGIAVGAFYYLQPYLENLAKVYGNLSGLVGKTGTFQILDLQSLL